MREKSLTSITDIAQSIMQDSIKEGDTVIDATAGNGNDTLLLAKMVGLKGKVIAFDIQAKAIENTSNLLIEQNLHDRVILIQDSHEYIDKYVDEEISGGMFNLGYLPKSDHHIMTKPRTTIIALEKCLRQLKKNGVITLSIYYGHPGGQTEKEAVLHYAKNLNKQQFHVLKIDFINQTHSPPLLIAIVKK
jgi:tRNA A58 N-methylase Trm61